MIAGLPKAKYVPIARLLRRCAACLFLCLLATILLSIPVLNLSAIKSASPDTDRGVVPAAATGVRRVDDMLGGAVEPDHTDGARYCLASVQASSGLTVENGSATGRLYFYNVDGNRTTHIDLKTAAAPDGIWVEYAAGAHLEIIPTDIFPEPVETVPEGMVNLTLPSKLGAGVDGYCLAHVVVMDIVVMEAAAVIGDVCVEILATASWPGQKGQASIQQTRTFRFSVAIE